MRALIGSVQVWRLHTVFSVIYHCGLPLGEAYRVKPQHKSDGGLFLGIDRGWKEKWGDQSKALRHAPQPMSESSVQAAMKGGRA